MNLSGCWVYGLCDRVAVRGREGKISVLGGLKKTPHGTWLEDKGLSLAELGKKAVVNWPAEEPWESQDLEFQIVSCRIVKDGRNYECPYSVQRSGRNNKWQIEPIGAWIIRHRREICAYNPSVLDAFDSGSVAYTLCKSDKGLVGPWRVLGHQGEKALVPFDSKFGVYRFPDEFLVPEMIVEIDGADYLLSHPDPDLGEILDIASPPELTAWLVEELRSVAPDILTSFDNAVPKWRNDLVTKIEGLSDRHKRELYRSRWKRVEPIVDTIAFGSETFEEILDTNTTLQALLQTNIRHRLEELALPSPAVPARKSSLPAPTDIDQPDITEELRILSHALTRWVGPVPDKWVRTFYLAFTGCPWLLAPDIGWAKACQEALGPQSRLDFFSVSPDWLSFADLWKAGFKTVWEQAHANEAIIYIVALEGIERTFNPDWLRPLCLMRGGLLDRLSGFSDQPWPVNLRIFYIPRAVDGVFPNSILEVCGALPRELKLDAQTEYTEAPVAHLTAIHSLLRHHPSGKVATPVLPVSEFHCCKSQDIDRVAALSVALGDEVERATRLAQKVRLEWPATYVEGGLNGTN
jgi:hypothetical protein